VNGARNAAHRTTRNVDNCEITEAREVPRNRNL
jgi:hypothetical protein